jgi:hypothetical protein
MLQHVHSAALELRVDHARSPQAHFFEFSYSCFHASDSYKLLPMYPLLAGNLIASIYVSYAPSQATLGTVDKEKLRYDTEEVESTASVVLTEMSPSMRLKTGGKNLDDTSGGSC